MANYSLYIPILLSLSNGVTVRLDSWPELKAWYMKLKTKEEQDMNLLISQIKQAGGEIYNHQGHTVRSG